MLASTHVPFCTDGSPLLLLLSKRYVARGHSVKRSDAAILLVIVVLMMLGSMPAWRRSRERGYYPSGGLSLVLLVLDVFMLSGRL